MFLLLLASSDPLIPMFRPSNHSVLLPDGSTQPLTEAGRRAILAAVNKMADGALRCLALAHKVCMFSVCDYVSTDSTVCSPHFLVPSQLFGQAQSDLCSV